MTCTNPIFSRPLAIGLGANIPSNYGNPTSTLIAIRPEIEKNIHHWLLSSPFEKYDNNEIIKSLRFRWSPLFETVPLGGPSNQPNFINAVVVIDGEVFSSLIPSKEAIYKLFDKFQVLEKAFGRAREPNQTRWGPRTIDIDLLAWGSLQVKTKQLTLPHPRLTERTFVLIPLAAALNSTSTAPRQLCPQKGWPQ